MIYKKLCLSILLAVCLCLESLALPVSAHEVSAFGYTETDINQMNDKEFLDYVNSAVTQSISFEQAQNTLSSVGVNFKQISQLSFHRLANGDKSWFSRRFRHLSYREKLRITLRPSAQLSVQK